MSYIGEKIPITIENCENYAPYGNTWYREEGLYLHVHIGVGGLTGNESVQIANMPVELRPTEDVIVIGFAADAANVARISVQVNGKVFVFSSESYAVGDLYYLKP